MNANGHGRAVATPDLGEQWRAHLAARSTPATTVTLPSGMTVRATRPSLLDLLRTGALPDPLAAQLADLMAAATAAGGVRAELARRQAADPVGFATLWLRVVDAVWLAAVVAPRFAERADDPGAVPLSAVAIDDKTYLFVWTQGSDAAVAAYLARTTGTPPP